MANTYKVIPKLISLDTIADVYEVPAATTSIIRSISVYNTDGSAMNVTLTVYDSGSTTAFAYDYKASLAAATKFEFLNSDNSILLVLEEADKLQVTCSTTGGLNLIVSALEMSRS
jgi:hypothetical protein|tara:strand:+ start:264 stop:608 length:345 start_codon:yes stop_codon:yes gene_type:complete